MVTHLYQQYRHNGETGVVQLVSHLRVGIVVHLRLGVEQVLPVLRGGRGTVQVPGMHIPTTTTASTTTTTAAAAATTTARQTVGQR